MYKLDGLAPNTVAYLNSLRKLLKGFGISTYEPSLNQRYVRPKDKQGVSGFVLRIRQKQSLIAYMNEIGFDTDDKKKRLSALSSQLVGR